MADLSETALAYHASQLIAHQSQTVTYRRGSWSVSISAALGSQLLRLNDRLGNVKVERTDRDFIFKIADLVLHDDQVEPKRGDTIELTQGGVVREYEVMSPEGEPAWRYQDPHRTLVRVHTKYKGVIP